jgi:hypothetical protein
MREVAPTLNPVQPNARILWTGAVLLTMGLCLVLFAAESFADFDACLANPFCTPPDSVTTLTDILGLMVLGVGMGVGGAILLLFGWVVPTRSASLRTPTS